MATQVQQFKRQPWHIELPCDNHIKSFNERLWQQLKTQFQNAKKLIGCSHSHLTYNQLYLWMEKTFKWPRKDLIEMENFKEQQFDFDKDRIIDYRQFGRNVVLRVVQEAIHIYNRQHDYKFNQELSFQAFISVLDLSFSFMGQWCRNRDEYQRIFNQLACNGTVNRSYFLTWRNKYWAFEPKA